jgi:DNA helicase-2/ATP-dependent DNA helicase PcrA
MVVIDDTEARGFMFKYDKLFSEANSRSNAPDDKESTADRTRRLFYVTCSRAESSLAIVAYSQDPKGLAKTLEQTGWFGSEEIIVMN